MENHQNWLPHVCRFGDSKSYRRADLSPFGMTAGAFSKFLHLFTVHSHKIGGIQAPSSIRKRAQFLDKVTDFLCSRMRKGQVWDTDLCAWIRWQAHTRWHLSQMISCFADSIHGIRSTLCRVNQSLLEDPCSLRQHALLRSVECQWKLCYKVNRYDKHKNIGKFKKCGSCKVARYCSSRCQKMDRNRGCHKQICLNLTRSIMDDI